jgi:hypothetical protein
MPHSFSYPPSPPQDEPPKTRRLSKALLTAGGVHAETMIALGHSQEISDTKIRGAIGIGSASVIALGFGTVSHLALGDGSFNPWLTIGSAALAFFVGVTDNYAFYRASIPEQGELELAKVGLSISTMEKTRSSSFFGLPLRVAQGATLGALSGLFVVVAANITDVNARIESDYLHENRVAATTVSKPIDAEIGRATAAVTAQTAQVTTLAKQVTALQSRAVSPGRRDSIVSTPALESQLVAFEGKRADAEAKLEDLNRKLAKLVAGRNEAVLKAIETSPEHSPRRNGFFGKINALGAMTRDDPKLLAITLALDFVFLCMELAPVIAKQRYIPSAYAAYVTLEQYVATVRLAKNGADRLAAFEQGDCAVGPGERVRPDVPASSVVGSNLSKEKKLDDVTAGSNGGTPLSTMKRKRGRPLKVIG